MARRTVGARRRGAVGLAMEGDPETTQRPGTAAGRVYERRRAARLRRDPSSEAPAHELAWLKGDVGEQRLGRRLEDDAALVGSVGVLHDLVADGERANVDHVVVGPAGVTVIDAKAWSGRIGVGRQGVGAGGRRRRKPIEGMRRQLDLVRGVLADAGRQDIPVSGVLCFVNDNEGLPPDVLLQVDGIPLGRTGPVVRHAMRNGSLVTREVADVMALLGEALEARGGRFEPREGRVSVNAPKVAPAPVRRAVKQPEARRPPQAQPRPSSRRGAGAAVARAVIILVALAAILVAYRQLRPVTRAAVDAQRVVLRARAARLAGGAVHGPRIGTRGGAIVLTYRRGTSCVVRLRVRRGWGTGGLAHPRASRSGCRGPA